MSNDAKFFFAMVWFYSLLGTALFFHDFGMLEGARIERQQNGRNIKADAKKLDNCLAVIKGGK